MMADEDELPWPLRPGHHAAARTHEPLAFADADRFGGAVWEAVVASRENAEQERGDGCAFAAAAVRL